MRPISNFNFGDAELRHIAFDFEEVALNFFDPNGVSYVSVVLRDVRFLAFYTNFSQNVVGSVNILTRNEFDEALSSAPFSHSGGLEHVDLSGELSFVQITPTAGPDLLSACGSSELKLSM